ncbi:MAG: hypothetical protein ACQCN6_13625 [Candidatus Bathyarchaeia archaeon]|jgi:hypothetical protein
MVKPINAQVVVSKPFAPEFTLNFIQAYDDSSGAIEIKVKNQQFDPPNNLTKLEYYVRFKGHSEENWWTEQKTALNEVYLYPQNASGKNTVIVYPQEGFPISGQVDFQVQAIIATYRTIYYGFDAWEYDNRSDWSSTQTITLPQNSLGPSATVPELPIVLSLVAVLAAVSLLLVTGKRKGLLTIT